MISFGITTHDEGIYIQELLDQLVPYCEQSGDEIVVVDDFSTDEFTRTLLDSYAGLKSIKLYQHSLNNDFAAHKNFLNDMCSGDYIFQVDADEKFNDNLLLYLHDIVENNSHVDLFLVPRVNVVTGLTDEDIVQWGWNVNENGWVQWPDLQSRLYRNHEDIFWSGKVHERITGYKIIAPLPPEEEWALYHIKDVVRQRQQNNFYESLIK